MTNVPSEIQVMISVFEHYLKFAFSGLLSVFRKRLDLLKPIYTKTAAYGHFGRSEPEFGWERTDAAERLQKACKADGGKPHTESRASAGN